MKKKKHLTQEQRYTIARMLQAGCTKKEICVAIGKDKSVLSRELHRNSYNRGYSPRLAQQYANERKERFKRKRRFTESIQGQLIKCLQEEQWSPEQIVGWARKEDVPMVSHERIYQYIRRDKAQGGTLYKHLRHRLKHRKRPVSRQVLISDKVSIEQRPEIINRKGRFGDWEIDTIVGKEHKGAILTVTERRSGFLLMKKLPKGKNAKALAMELFYLLLPYKKMVLSITSDNGGEFCEHQRIAKLLSTEFYFAHPYCAWERGLNEYTNKLIRQYIPKKESFTNYDDEYIKHIQYKINRRPRKLLNFASPWKVFSYALNNPVAFDT
jgi:IS30 family transposase